MLWSSRANPKRLKKRRLQLSRLLSSEWSPIPSYPWPKLSTRSTKRPLKLRKLRPLRLTSKSKRALLKNVCEIKSTVHRSSLIQLKFRQQLKERHHLLRMRHLQNPWCLMIRRHQAKNLQKRITRTSMRMHKSTRLRLARTSLRISSQNSKNNCVTSSAWALIKRCRKFRLKAKSWLISSMLQERYKSSLSKLTLVKMPSKSANCWICTKGILLLLRKTLPLFSKKRKRSSLNSWSCVILKFRLLSCVSWWRFSNLR